MSSISSGAASAKSGAIVVAGLVLACVVGLGAVTSGLAVTPSDGGASKASKTPPVSASEQGERPNVVVIMTDDQEAKSVGVMKNVKRLLAEQGATFRRNFATFPLCCPSRATFLTGLYAHNHRIRSNKPPKGGYERFREATATLPVFMSDGGYRTGYVGRYLNGYGRTGSDPREIPSGWDSWHGFPKLAMYAYPVNENGHIRRYGSDPPDYQTDVLARKSARFIRREANRSEPFFLSIATLAPHSEASRAGEIPDPRPAPRHKELLLDAPLRRAPSFNERDVSDKPRLIRRVPPLGPKEIAASAQAYRDRLGSLLAVDDLVKRVVDELRASGELRNTLILFTSDNGFLLGEHRRTRKTTLYEESVRVPLIMRGPGIPRGVHVRQLVGNVDLAPTILDVAGVEPAHVMDGRSVIPLTRDPGAGEARAILLENRGVKAIRTPRFMYAEHLKRGATPRSRVDARELYDIRTDPFQLDSRHADPRLRETRERLAARLHRLVGCEGPECP